MIFGIDFGTTYTVIAWTNENKIIFLEDGKLFRTKFNDIENIKLLIAQDGAKYHELAYGFFMQMHALLGPDIYEIKDCVLTVPARFDDLARNAIKSAAISAGFNVLKLLAEPVAAAIFAIKNKKNGYYIIYDLGGGTFDISLLKLQDDVFHILAIDGLRDFGGINIDKIIAQELNITESEAMIYKENGKFQEELYEKIEDALKKTYAILFDMLKNNNLKNIDINGIILAGGSSKLPMIYKKLIQDFIVYEDENPSLMVAGGAAQHGASLLNHSHLLIDVTPFNLGIEVLGEKMEIIIPKNSPIPFSQTQYFYKVNNQKVVINILQGVTDLKDECISLAKFEIDSQDAFAVTFMIDCDGIVSVKVADQVVILSKIQNAIFENQELNLLYQKAMQYIADLTCLNLEQKKSIQYLEQAKSIGISPQALKWLNIQFEKLFISNYSK